MTQYETKLLHTDTDPNLILLYHDTTGTLITETLLYPFYKMKSVVSQSVPPATHKPQSGFMLWMTHNYDSMVSVQIIACLLYTNPLK